MKKRPKKLNLNRDTLYRIGIPRLQRVFGGTNRASGVETCGACDTVASCSELAEDCCVTTVE